MIVGIMKHPDRPIPQWLPDIKNIFEKTIVYEEYHDSTKEGLCGLLQVIQFTYQPKPTDYVLILTDDITLGDNFIDAVELLISQISAQKIPMLQLFTNHIDLLSEDFGIHKTKPVSQEYYYLNREGTIDMDYAVKNIYPRCYANLYVWAFATIVLSAEKHEKVSNVDYLFLTQVMENFKVSFYYVNPSFVKRGTLPRLENEEQFNYKVSDLNHSPIKAIKIFETNYFKPDLNLRNLVLDWSSDKE